jgi:hypothetical protein
MARLSLHPWSPSRTLPPRAARSHVASTDAGEGTMTDHIFAQLPGLSADVSYSRAQLYEFARETSRMRFVAVQAQQRKDRAAFVAVCVAFSVLAIAAGLRTFGASVQQCERPPMSAVGRDG